jgi:hypothetical protein
MNFLEKKLIQRALSCFDKKKNHLFRIEDVGPKGYYGLEAVPVMGFFVAF